MTDETFEVYEKLWAEIHDLVDKRLKKVPEAEAEEVRDRLTDEFRFWKRQTRA